MRRIFAAAIGLLSAVLFVAASLSPADAKTRHRHMRAANVQIVVNDDYWACTRNPDYPCGGGTYYGYMPSPVEQFARVKPAKVHKEIVHVPAKKRFVMHERRSRVAARAVFDRAKAHSLDSGSSPYLVTKARQYLGTNPTGWARLWCGRFMAMIAPEAAARVRNPNYAKDWASLPRTSAHVGAIAVMGRRGGGHIGVVSGFDARGNPIIISGNAGGRSGNRHVSEGVYSRHRIIAYVSAS